MKVFLLSIFAFSCLASEAGVENFGYGGSGCPQGSAVFSEDEQAYTLTLSGYEAVLGTNLLDRKTCNVAMPIDVPEGYQVNIGRITIEGIQDLSANSSLRINADTFFAGTRGPEFAFASNGPDLSQFEHVIMPRGMWSPCGSDVIIRVNTSMFLKRNTRESSEPSLAFIDSIRFGRPIFHKCN